MSDEADFDDQEMDVDLSQDDNVSNVFEDEDDDDSGDSDIDAEVQMYEKYAEILNQISAEYYVYDRYVQLVQVAHQLKDLDKIRESCELFSMQFPLSPEIWTKWLQIELTIATSETELHHLRGLFNRALGDYFSVTVGGLYSQMAAKMPNPQEIWDEVLSTYSLDCMEGSTFFKDWRNYYTKHVPESPEKVAKLLETFIYELSLPLAGIAEAYNEFCEFVERYQKEVDWEKINETYHKAKDNLYPMLKFEEQLVLLEDKEHHKRESVYSEYIEKSKTFLNEHMVQILYERMVAACCLSASTWLKYIKYLISRETELAGDKILQVFKQTPLDILNRALRNCTWSAELYIEKIRLSEKAGIAKNDVIAIAQQAFEATNNDVKGHLSVWLEYLSYIKRNTNFSDEKEIEILRKTMELGQDSLERRSSSDWNGEFYKLCARIEYGPLKNAEQGIQHYEKVMKIFNNRSKAILWIEFAHLELSKDVDAARRVYRRAIKVKNIDDFYAAISSWKSFEYTYGTSSQISACHTICDKIEENYNKQNVLKAKAQKRKPESDGDLKIPEKKEKKEKKFDESTSKPPKQKKPEPINPKVEHKFGEKDDVSIFLSNLADDVTKEQIIAVFPELIIKDVSLVVEPNGRCKGYGYVELSNPSEVEKAIQFDRRPIDGRPVFIKKVLRDKNIRSTLKYSEGVELNKIFIKGLPFDTTNDELQILFGTFGTIKDIRMIMKKNGQFKGYAFIDYESDQVANKAVETMNSYVLRDFKIIVAISNPPPKTENTRPANVTSNPFSRFRTPLPRSEAKPRLTFIPTAVRRSTTQPPALSSTNGSHKDKPSTPKSNDYFRQLLNKK